MQVYCSASQTRCIRLCPSKYTIASIAFYIMYSVFLNVLAFLESQEKETKILYKEYISVLLHTLELSQVNYRMCYRSAMHTRLC